MNLREINAFLQEHIGKKVVDEETKEEVIIWLSCANELQLVEKQHDENLEQATDFKANELQLVGKQQKRKMRYMRYSTIDPRYFRIISGGEMPVVSHPLEFNGIYYEGSSEYQKIQEIYQKSDKIQ